MDFFFKCEFGWSFETVPGDYVAKNDILTPQKDLGPLQVFFYFCLVWFSSENFGSSEKMDTSLLQLGI